MQLQAVMHRASYRASRKCSPYRGQGRVLGLLARSPEMTQKELGAQLDISKQSLTELLSKLEKSGCVVREHSKQDRRVMTISLTPAGRALAEETESGSRCLEELLGCFDDEELSAFGSYLGRVLAHAEELGDGSENCLYCRGPEHCSHDYLKYGHDAPNPEYCKFVRGAGKK